MISKRVAALLLVALMVPVASMDFSAVSRATASGGSQGVVDWRQFQGNASHAGFSQNVGPTNPIQAWTYNLGGSRDGLVATGTLVIASSPDTSSLIGLADSNGSVAYQYSTKPPNYCPSGATVTESSYPAVSGDLLLSEIDQGSNTNCGLGLNPPQWSPALGADYLNNQPGYFASIVPGASESPLYGWGLVSDSNGYVFFSGYGDSHLAEFVASSGTQVWQDSLGGSIDTIPTVGGNEVVVGYSNLDEVSAISLSGTSLWNASTSSGATSTLSYSGGIFYLGTTDGTLYAISSSGSVIWDKNIGSAIESTPAIAFGRIYFGADDGNLYALDAANGNLDWKTNLGGLVQGSPAVSSNGMVYDGSTNGNFVGVNATTGQTVWSKTFGSGISSSPALDNGYVFVVDSSGLVHALADTSAVTTTTTSTATTAGVVYSVPIIITNAQPVATGAPFQQMLTIDMSSYANYAAPNLQNVEFFDSSGNVIPSWLESGNSNTATNTVYWLNLQGGIPASSSLTVYMGFASTSTNLFNGQTIGEAPELSPTYGEYDNGANMFTSYQNFNVPIDTVPPGWYDSGSTGGCSYVHNSNTPGYQVVGVNGCGTVYAGSNIPVNANTAVDIQVYSLQAVGTDWQAPFVNSASATSFSPQGDALTWFDNNAQCNAYNSSATLALSSGPGGNQIANAPPTFPATVLTVTNTEVDSDYSPIITGQSGILGSSGYLAFATSTSTSCGSAIDGWWVRTRSLPPNGVMPTVSGVSPGVTTTQTSTTTSIAQGAPTVTLSTPQISGLSVSINGAAQPGASVTSISWQWGDGQTTVGYFPQTHTYSRPGTYTVVVTATYSNGQTASATEAVSVSSQAQTSSTTNSLVTRGASPQVTLSVISVNGLQVELNATITPSGGAYITSIGGQWGNGIPLRGSFPQVFIYQQPGVYTIVVNATDSSGRTGSASISVTVPPGYVPPYIYESIAAVVAIIVAGIIVFLFRRGRKHRTTLEANKKLENLKKLLDQGLITQAEFDEQKRKLIGA